MARKTASERLLAICGELIARRENEWFKHGLLAHGRDPYGEAWSSLLSFKDRDGVLKKLLLENGELYRTGREHLIQLAGAGLEIEPTASAENLLGRYLKSATRTYSRSIPPVSN